MATKEKLILKAHQVDGVQWLIDCYQNRHGCILADEMGLGKTAQAIELLNRVSYQLRERKKKCQFLILSPLSVLSNWQQELTRFGPELEVITYSGSKEDRQQLQDEVIAKIRLEKNWSVAALPYNVFLTTYEICMKDMSFLRQFTWNVLIVDEAHRLKNSQSVLYQSLKQFSIQFSLLLTGTPIQNNLRELYSLLCFIETKEFKLDNVDDFIEQYSEVMDDKDSDAANDLRSLIKPYILRRVKNEVMKDLPIKSEIVVDTGLSQLQRKLYKGLLERNIETISSSATKLRLMNMLIQLRKCVNHPYLFDGIEPEPFQIGDHLIDASGKLYLLDKLLPFLKSRGHKVLVFSQMTRLLDILQDYLTYKGYNYERLDGSVRGEERYLAIRNFSDSDVFIFMLSTKAGGVGLNLVSADTVVFFDTDFNPQNDIQAAARCHRIGQTKPVKVIRLISQNTVEEIILRRAQAKLKLTMAVIEGGHLSSSSGERDIDETINLLDIIKFGLDKLLQSDESTIAEQDFESLLGKSKDGKWVVEESIEDAREVEKDESFDENMYHYEGHDYSRDPSREDKTAFDTILAQVQSVKEEDIGQRTLRSEKSIPFDELPVMIRKRKPLTPEQLEERRKRRAELAAKKAKLEQEAQERRERRVKEKIEKWWQANGYATTNLLLDSEGESDEEDDSIDDELSGDTQQEINYVKGDITMPKVLDGGDAIIVHCVDDSGRWGKGGVFSALSARSVHPEQQYALAGKMQDLNLGDAHLIPVDDKLSRNSGNDYVALLVAQTRNRRNQLSPIDLSSLTTGFQRIAKEAKRINASVHLPRIGYATPQFNWYATERLIRQHLVLKGIPTYVYYYARKKSTISKQQQPGPSTQTSKDPFCNPKDTVDVKVTSPLPNLFANCTFFIDDMKEDAKRELRRYIIAFDGDLSSKCDETVTHIVCDDQLNLETISKLKSKFPDRTVLMASVLKQCIASQGFDV